MAATSQDRRKFEDYEAFTEKFKPKKTTDDCYTPPAVYEAVKAWVAERICPLEGFEVVRPFCPGGDYVNYDYPANALVLDNPPFSILAQICRFYNEQGIKYFLFAPGLTLFGPSLLETFVVAHCNVVYENGAVVRTCFRTNLLGGDPAVMVAGDLYQRVKEAQQQPDKSQRKIELPPEVITSARLGRLAEHGAVFEVARSDCQFVRKLDLAQGTLFGSGFLLSERAAAERAAAERAAAERAAAERAAAEFVRLSERERAITRRLGAGQAPGLFGG